MMREPLKSSPINATNGTRIKKLVASKEDLDSELTRSKPYKPMYARQNLGATGISLEIGVNFANIDKL